MAKLLDKFVCVRAVQMYGVDLNIFQFDGNLTWAVFLMHPDKTIYGRYGSRSERDATVDISPEGFNKAMAAALDMHARHKDVKKSLAGKSGAKPKWRTAETMPGHKGRFKFGDTSRMGCLHCHYVDEGFMKSSWVMGKKVPDREIWSWPMPAALGFDLDPKEMATVTDVKADTAAARAGLQKGDKIRKMKGQPIISIADVQWVMHEAKAPSKIKMEVDRGGETKSLTLSIAKEWRRKWDYAWRDAKWGIFPGIAGKDAPANERKQNKIADDELAIKIGGVHIEWGQVAEKPWNSHKSGLRKNDIIIAINGDKKRRDQAAFIAWFWQNTKPGQTVVVTVLRGGKQKNIKVLTPR